MRWRKKHVRGDRRHDQGVQVGGRQAAFHQGLLCRFGRQIAGRDAFIDDVALRMPVRSTIQSFEVSTSFSRSSLVNRRGGT